MLMRRRRRISESADDLKTQPYGGVDVWLHIFLISALDGRKWTASALPPEEIAPNFRWIWGWRLPKSLLLAYPIVKENNLYCPRESNHKFPIVQQVA
jgi:hypothetical protein